MSTKERLRSHDKDGNLPGWELYTELFEADSVYLQLDGVEAEITMTGNMERAPGTVLLRLPVATARQLGLVPATFTPSEFAAAPIAPAGEPLRGSVRRYDNPTDPVWPAGEPSWSELEQELARDDDSAAREHLNAGNPVYIGAPEAWSGSVMRLHPDGRREIVQLDRQTGEFSVVAELDPLPPDAHWWRRPA